MSVLPTVQWEVTGEDYILGVLERLVDEVRDERRFLRAVADEVLAVEGEFSLKRAREIPLSQASLERRRRGRFGKWHQPGRFPTPIRYGRQGKRRTDPLPRGRDAEPLPQSGMGAGIQAVLTSGTIHYRSAGGQAKYSPVALREFHGNVLYWGSKRWVSGWIGYHMQLVNPRPRMPARIDFMTGESRAEIMAAIPSVLSSQLFEALEAAGAPSEWLDETRIERAAFGRYGMEAG